MEAEESRVEKRERCCSGSDEESVTKKQRMEPVEGLIVTLPLEVLYIIIDEVYYKRMTFDRHSCTDVAYGSLQHTFNIVYNRLAMVCHAWHTAIQKMTHLPLTTWMLGHHCGVRTRSLANPLLSLLPIGVTPSEYMPEMLCRHNGDVLGRVRQRFDVLYSPPPYRNTKIVIPPPRIISSEALPLFYAILCFERVGRAYNEFTYINQPKKSIPLNQLHVTVRLHQPKRLVVVPLWEMRAVLRAGKGSHRVCPTTRFGKLHLNGTRLASEGTHRPMPHYFTHDQAAFLVSYHSLEEATRAEVVTKLTPSLKFEHIYAVRDNKTLSTLLDSALPAAIRAVPILQRITDSFIKLRAEHEKKYGDEWLLIKPEPVSPRY